MYRMAVLLCKEAHPKTEAGGKVMSDLRILFIFGMGAIAGWSLLWITPCRCRKLFDWHDLLMKGAKR